MKYIGVLGFGVVGGGVVKIIDSKKTDELKQLQVKRILVKDDKECTDPRCTTNIEDIINDEEISIVVECMGGIEPANTFISRAIEHHKHVVTSNKKMLANKASELYPLAIENNVYLKEEATCGGGIPWMANIDRIHRIDEITSFQGIFNGTTNYILTKMTQEDIDFTTCLRQAQSLGYAEQDPTDDIDGYDVRYKVMLSSLKAFHTLLHTEDIVRFGIRHISKDAMNYANENNLTIKLLGQARKYNDHMQAYVMPIMLRNDDIFANVNLNYNMILCDATTLGPSSYFGQGAGSLPTAHAVIQDIMDIVHQTSSPYAIKQLPIDNSNVIAKFYVESTNTIPSNYIDTQLSTNTHITKEIPLSTLVELMKDDPEAFVAEVRQ